MKELKEELKKTVNVQKQNKKNKKKLLYMLALLLVFGGAGYYATALNATNPAENNPKQQIASIEEPQVPLADGASYEQVAEKNLVVDKADRVTSKKVAGKKVLSGAIASAAVYQPNGMANDAPQLVTIEEEETPLDETPATPGNEDNGGSVTGGNAGGNTGNTGNAGGNTGNTGGETTPPGKDETGDQEKPSKTQDDAVKWLVDQMKDSSTETAKYFAKYTSDISLDSTGLNTGIVVRAQLKEAMGWNNQEDFSFRIEQNKNGAISIYWVDEDISKKKPGTLLDGVSIYDGKAALKTDGARVKVEEKEMVEASSNQKKPIHVMIQQRVFSSPVEWLEYSLGDETSTAYKYFKTRTVADASLDSNGKNWGKPISAQMEKDVTGLADTAYTWKIVRVTAGKENYNIYWYQESIEGVKDGTLVSPVACYNTVTGKTTDVTMMVEKGKLLVYNAPEQTFKNLRERALDLFVRFEACVSDQERIDLIGKKYANNDAFRETILKDLGGTWPLASKAVDSKDAFAKSKFAEEELYLNAYFSVHNKENQVVLYVGPDDGTTNNKWDAYLVCIDGTWYEAQAVGRKVNLANIYSLGVDAWFETVKEQLVRVGQPEELLPALLLLEEANVELPAEEIVEKLPEQPTVGGELPTDDAEKQPDESENPADTSEKQPVDQEGTEAENPEDKTAVTESPATSESDSTVNKEEPKENEETLAKEEPSKESTTESSDSETKDTTEAESTRSE